MMTNSNQHPIESLLRAAMENIKEMISVILLSEIPLKFRRNNYYAYY